jgi:transposase
MKTPTKFVQPLTDEQRKQLKEVRKSQSSQRTRMRAHAILLSERRDSLDQIADIDQVDRDRVSEWLDWWAEAQFEGLEDDPRSGRPSKLTEKEQRHAVKLTLKEPRSLRQGLTAIASKVGKIISRDTLKRIWVAEDYGGKRLRRSLRSLRDEAECRAAQAALAALRAEALAPARQCDLWSFDAAGFPLTPCVPYAWQKVGQTLELASSQSPRQNRLGFFNRQHEFHACAFAGTIDTQTVIHCFPLFHQRRDRPAVVVVAKAPLHTSDDFAEQKILWQAQALAVKFIPPYCPDLNLIEILWRKIKYEGLPLNAYQNFKAMTRALFEVLRGIGPKYRITFA